MGLSSSLGVGLSRREKPRCSPLDVFGADLIGWWRLDQGVTLNGGTISGLADQSGTGNHLTQTTAADQLTYVADAGDGRPAALGTVSTPADELHVADNATLGFTTGFTFACWFKRTSLAVFGYSCMAAQWTTAANRRWDLSVFTDTGLTLGVEFFLFNATTADCFALDCGRPHGEWIHFAGVYDGSFVDADVNVQNAGRAKVYVNAVPITLGFATSNVPGSLVDGSAAFQLMRRNTSPGQGGSIDDSVLVRRPATAGEIGRIYNYRQRYG